MGASLLVRCENLVISKFFSPPDSQADLLNHLCTVPLKEYRKHRQLLESAETTRRFMYCLHRDAEGTLQRLVVSYANLTNPPKTPLCTI